MAGDGKKELEHPKPLIEVMENTWTAVEDYARVNKISSVESALILTLNELRCIHWHFDMMMNKKEH